MSKADEMFKELGWNKKARYAGDAYIKINEYETQLYFRNLNVVDIINEDGENVASLTFDEIKAMYKKVKEMEYND